MKLSVGLATLACAFLLGGCAGQKSQHTVLKAADGSSLEVKSAFAAPDLNGGYLPDTHLRVVSPAHMSAGMGLKVLTAVLGGGISTSGFSKEDYKGNRIDALSEPTQSYLLPKATTQINKWLSENGKGHSYGQSLNISAARWALIYKDMSTENSDYELQYRVIFYKRPEGGSLFSAFVIATCSPTVEVAPRSDWEANNYAKVTQVTQKYMDACLLELNNQLPRLLKQS